MNSEVRDRLKAKFGSQSVRTGGRGTVRRKKKAFRKNATQDDKRLQSTLKKLNVNTIPAIEEVNLFQTDGRVIQLINPKVQAAIAANTYVVSGEAQVKSMQDLLPANILQQLGASGSSLEQLQQLAAAYGIQQKAGQEPAILDEDVKPTDDDEVPDLVDNFEAASANVE